MPRLIDPGTGEAITPDELADALDAAPFDPRDEDSLAAFGPLLARLGRHPTFLADLAVAELERRCTGQEAASAYGAQVFLLRPPNGRYVLRANFWPALADAAMRASGPGAFFYDLPHDHNFSFLTVGYRGPGYWSDYYERNDALVGLPGETAGLRFVERARLEEGKLMLYRAHRDIHVQLPPDAFSVSLNILAYDLGQPWRSQYRFDTRAGTVAEALTTTPSEALVALGVHLGGEAGVALAETLAARHPSSRMRATATIALASAAPSPEERGDLLDRAARDRDPLVAGTARAHRARMQP